MSCHEIDTFEYSVTGAYERPSVFSSKWSWNQRVAPGTGSVVSSVTGKSTFSL